jgi:hypothetical protein
MEKVDTMRAPQPAIGQWYRTGGKEFEVVAADEDEGTIEIQYFDGTIGELDREDWESQWLEGQIEAAEPPEDWTGSVDVESADIDNDSNPSGSPDFSSLEKRELP